MISRGRYVDFLLSVHVDESGEEWENASEISAGATAPGSKLLPPDARHSESRYVSYLFYFGLNVVMSSSHGGLSQAAN